MRILHCFADQGVESEALSAFGDVYRIGLNAVDTNKSQPIKADARHLPIKSDVRFDLGLFHPPCQSWTPGAAQHGTQNEHPNLIPLAREIAEQHCGEWIIENVPNAPLNNPVTLNGGMFGSPLHYERAFETSYHVEQPRNQTRLTTDKTMEKHHDTGGWFGDYELWQSVKGYSGDYNAKSLKRSAIPRAYINYLVRPLLTQAQTQTKRKVTQ